MTTSSPKVLLAALLLVSPLAVSAQPRPAPPPLGPEDTAAAEADYQRYCALCHGPDRAGHANDHAPSLKSESLLRTAFPWVLRESIAYGRPGTPMGGYLDEIGGPMSMAEVRRMVMWLREQGGSPEPIRVGSERVGVRRAGVVVVGDGVHVRRNGVIVAKSGIRLG